MHTGQREAGFERETTKEDYKQLKCGATQECFKYVEGRIGQGDSWDKCSKGKRTSLEKPAQTMRLLSLKHVLSAEEENGTVGGRVQNTNNITNCAMAFLEEI